MSQTIDEASAVQTGTQTYLGQDESELLYRFWNGLSLYPVLIYVHGIEGHSLWFDRTARMLSLKGFNVCAADRRGAALNQNKECHEESYKTLISDLHCLIQHIQGRYPDSPLILFGNCWGATLAIIYAEACKFEEAFKRYKHLLTPVQGLILSCPALGTLCDLDWITKLEVAMCYVFGLRKEFAFPLTPEMFTRTPQFLDFIEKDNLRTVGGTAKFLIETLKMRHLAHRAAPNITLPVLLLQSEKDAIVDSNVVKKWFNRLIYPDVTYRSFDDANHCLDFEKDLSGYVDGISQWIAQRQDVMRGKK